MGMKRPEQRWERHPGPPLHDQVLAELHADPSKFRDHPTKIRILVEDIAAQREALRGVAALHTGAHYCGPAPNSFLWKAGEWCPTYLIVAATLSGYMRGGRWPKDEDAPDNATALATLRKMFGEED